MSSLMFELINHIRLYFKVCSDYLKTGLILFVSSSNGDVILFCRRETFENL